MKVSKSHWYNSNQPVLNIPRLTEDMYIVDIVAIKCVLTLRTAHRCTCKSHKHTSSFSQGYKLVQQTAMDKEHLYSEKDQGRDPAVSDCCWYKKLPSEMVCLLVLTRAGGRRLRVDTIREKGSLAGRRLRIATIRAERWWADKSCSEECVCIHCTICTYRMLGDCQHAIVRSHQKRRGLGGGWVRVCDNNACVYKWLLLIVRHTVSYINSHVKYTTHHQNS